MLAEFGVAVFIRRVFDRLRRCLSAVSSEFLVVCSLRRFRLRLRRRTAFGLVTSRLETVCPSSGSRASTRGKRLPNFSATSRRILFARKSGASKTAESIVGIGTPKSIAACEVHFPVPSARLCRESFRPAVCPFRRRIFPKPRR